MSRVSLRWVLVLLAMSVSPAAVRAAEPARTSETAARTAAPNAAVIYFHAFAAIPTLSAEETKRLEAATGSINSPLGDELKPIVARYRVALHELHRASEVRPCDWQLDYAAGPNLLLSHLQKARELARVALLRARMRFAEGERQAAVGDVLAVFKLARDCGSSPVLIAYLVDIAIEKLATDVLAAHLPLLKTDELDAVEKGLGALPESSDMAAAMAFEKWMFGDWLSRQIDEEAAKLKPNGTGGDLLLSLGRSTGLEQDLKPKEGDADGKRKADLLLALSVEDVRESLGRLQLDYAELQRIVALPVEKRTAALDAFESKMKAASRPQTREDALRYFSGALLPSLRNVILRDEQLQIRRQLIVLAIRVQRDGADKLPAIAGKPVEYHKTATGFELRCNSSAGVETIVVGRGT